MKDSIKILLGVIVALVVIGGAVAAFNLMNDDAKAPVDKNSSSDNKTDDVKNATLTSNQTNSSNDDNGNDSDIVKEEIKFNAQNGSGYYREVTYKDGGFRQFDLDTGELIGSSYASDQDKLPSME